MNTSDVIYIIRYVFLTVCMCYVFFIMQRIQLTCKHLCKLCVLITQKEEKEKEIKRKGQIRSRNRQRNTRRIHNRRTRSCSCEKVVHHVKCAGSLNVCTLTTSMMKQRCVTYVLEVRSFLLQ